MKEKGNNYTTMAETFDRVTGKLITNKGTEEGTGKVEKKLGKKIRPEKLVDPTANFDYIKAKNNVIGDLLELFPDTEFAGETLITGITNPTDTHITDIQMSSSTKKLPPATVAAMNTILKEEMDNYYNLPAVTDKAVHEMVLGSGAHAVLTISDKGLSEVLGNAKGESLGTTEHDLIKRYNAAIGKDTVNDIPGLTITRNPQFLVDMNLLKSVAEVHHGESITNEDIDIANMFKDVDFTESEEVVSINSSNDSEGRPMQMDIPTEAITIITDPHDYTKHILYIIAFDEKGSPIKALKTQPVTPRSDDTGGLQVHGYDFSETKKQVLTGVDAPAPINEGVTLEAIEQLINAEIINKLQNQPYSLGEPGVVNDIYKTMFRRALAGKRTTVLSVTPANLTYMQMEYRDNGTGRSVIDSLFYLLNMRGIIMVTELNAVIINNIPLKEYTIDIDDDEVDPEKVALNAISTILKDTGTQIPIGVTSIQGLTDWASKLGISITVNHISLPKHKKELNEKTRNVPIGDKTPLDTKIDKLITAKFGLTPDMFDEANRDDFAISKLYKNEVRVKKLLSRQRKVEISLSRFIKTVVREDGIVRGRLLNAIKADLRGVRGKIKRLENITDDDKICKFLLWQYMNSFTPRLPKPINDKVNDKMSRDIKDHSSNIEDYLDMLIPDDSLLEEISGKIGTKAEHIKAMIKSSLMMRKVVENGYMSEIHRALSSDETGEGDLSLFDEYHIAIDNLTKNFVGSYKPAKKKIAKGNKLLDNLGEEGDSDDDPEDDNRGNDTGAESGDKESGKKGDNKETPPAKENNDNEKGDKDTGDVDNI